MFIVPNTPYRGFIFNNNRNFLNTNVGICLFAFNAYTCILQHIDWYKGMPTKNYKQYMKLNTEDYNTIAQYETEFAHSVNENYFRIVNRNLLKNYADIYKRVFNRDSKILNGCSRCILQDIKALATIYFQDKKEMENEAKNTAIETPKEEKPKTAPKKNKNATKGKKTTKK